MVSHKNYNLNFIEYFVIFLTWKLTTCFVDGLTSKVKSQSIASSLIGSAHIYRIFRPCLTSLMIPINAYLLIGSAHIYRIFRPWRWVHSIWDFFSSSLPVCKDNVFLKSGGTENIFGSGSEILEKNVAGYSYPDLAPFENSWGVY